MASASLSAEARTETGKGVARKLRSAGRVPAIVYGHAREPQALSLQTRELEKLLSSIATGSTVVELTFGGATTKTLIREVQRHPFKKAILHVDFQELVAGEKVTVEIPLVYVGVPEGVRLSGALLEQILHSIEVLTDEDATICAVVAPRAVVEETPAAEGEEAAAAAAEPELIRKPKEEEETK
jgi:large subunit ribosomal protein L25